MSGGMLSVSNGKSKEAAESSAQFATLNRRLKLLETENNALKLRCSALNSENERLKKRLDALSQKLNDLQLQTRQRDTAQSDLLRQLGQRAVTEKGYMLKLENEQRQNLAYLQIVNCLENCLTQCGSANLCSCRLLAPDKLPTVDDTEAVCLWLREISNSVIELTRFNADLINDIFAKSNLSSHGHGQKARHDDSTATKPKATLPKIAEMTLEEQKERLLRKFDTKMQYVEHLSAKNTAKADELLQEVEGLNRLQSRIKTLDKKIAAEKNSDPVKKPAIQESPENSDLNTSPDKSIESEHDGHNEQTGQGENNEHGGHDGQGKETRSLQKEAPEDRHTVTKCQPNAPEDNSLRATHSCPPVPDHTNVRFKFNGCCYDPQLHKLIPAWELPSHQRVLNNVNVSISVNDNVKTIISEVKFKVDTGVTMEINPAAHSDLEMTVGKDKTPTDQKSNDQTPNKSQAENPNKDGHKQEPAYGTNSQSQKKDNPGAKTGNADSGQVQAPTEVEVTGSIKTCAGGVDATLSKEPATMTETQAADKKQKSADSTQENGNATIKHYVTPGEGIIKEVHHYILPPMPFVPSPEDLAASECEHITMEYKRTHNKFGFSDALLERLTVYKGDEIFDPIKYQGMDEAMYLARPLFVGCSLSQGAMVAALTQYGLCNGSKSRIHDFFSSIGNLGMSRAQFIELINMSIRCFLSGIADVIHEDILSRCHVLQIDESSMKVRQWKKVINLSSGEETETQDDTEQDSPEEPDIPGPDIPESDALMTDRPKPENTAEPQGKPGTKYKVVNKNPISYIWALTSGPHEAFQAVYYHAGERRTYAELCHALKLSYPPTPEECRNFVPEALMSDGYSCYRSLARDINRVINPEGREFIAANCLSHAHNKLIEAIRGFGQKDLFDRACKREGATEYFSERLARLAKEEYSKGLTVISRETMMITFIIDEIFSHERGFFGFKMADAELTRFRQGEQMLFDDMFERCRGLVSAYPDAFTSYVTKDGRTQYSCPRGYVWNEAIAYILNREIEFRNILKDGRLPVHDNDSERSIRTAVVTKHTQLFFNGVIGYKGFCALMTLYQTCKLNNVNFQNYLSWAVNCVKHRLERYRNESGIVTQMLKIPKISQMKITDDKGKVICKVPVDIYDKSNKLFYDQIDYHGLTPYDYWSLFLRDKLENKVKSWKESHS